MQRDVADHRRGDVDAWLRSSASSRLPAQQVGERARSAALCHVGAVARVVGCARYTSSPASRTSVTTSLTASLPSFQRSLKPVELLFQPRLLRRARSLSFSSSSAFVTSSATVDGAEPRRGQVAGRAALAAGVGEVEVADVLRQVARHAEQRLVEHRHDQVDFFLAVRLDAEFDLRAGADLSGDGGRHLDACGRSG